MKSARRAHLTARPVSPTPTLDGPTLFLAVAAGVSGFVGLNYGPYAVSWLLVRLVRGGC